MEYYKNVGTDIIQKKENIILYSKAKANNKLLDIILNLINTNSEYKTVEIKGFTKNEVIDLFKRSKLYIDFGYFPGPERLPREAVLCYCNILVTEKGSARNEIDYPISRKYKIEDFNDYYGILNKIIYMMEKYHYIYHDFDEMREKAEKQMSRFEDDVIYFIDQEKKNI